MTYVLYDGYVYLTQSPDYYTNNPQSEEIESYHMDITITLTETSVVHGHMGGA